MTNTNFKCNTNNILFTNLDFASTIKILNKLFNNQLLFKNKSYKHLKFAWDFFEK